MTNTQFTQEERVQLATDLRYALGHGCLAKRGIRHDDPSRHAVYEQVKQRVVKELAPEVQV